MPVPGSYRAVFKLGVMVVSVFSLYYMKGFSAKVIVYENIFFFFF